MQNNLAEFYLTAKGQILAWFLNRKLKNIVKVTRTESLLCLGFTTLYADNLIGKRKAYFAVDKDYVQSSSALVQDINLPLRDSEFEVVFAIHALEYVTEPQKLLEEVYRVLAPSGKFYLVLPNPQSFWRKSVIMGKTKFRHKEIRDRLRLAKFAVLDIERAVFYPPNKLKAANKILDRIFKVIFYNYSAFTIFECHKLMYGPRGRKLKITPSLKEIIIGAKAVPNP